MSSARILTVLLFSLAFVAMAQLPVTTMPGRRAYIDVLSRTTVTKVAEWAVNVPIANADEFSIQEFVPAENALYLFYSF